MAFPEESEIILFFREKNRKAPVRKEILKGEGPSRVSANNRFSLRWNLTRNKLKLGLRQMSGPELFLERLEVRAKPPEKNGGITLHEDLSPAAGYRLFQHGYHSWSISRMRRPRDVDAFALMRWKHDLDENPETPHQGRIPFLPGAWFPAPGKFHSEGFLGLEERDAKPPGLWLISTAEPGRQFVRFRVHLHPSSGRVRELAVIWDFNGMLFKPHSRTSLTAVHWMSRSREKDMGGMAELIDDNIRAIAPEFSPRKPKFRSLTGWCSWYYYYTEISENIIRENLHEVRENKLPLDFFQIDDGFQNHIGDWLTTNEKFPSGMKALAGEIADAGYRPGIWLAPFLVRPDSAVFRDHPEMILRHENGKPVRAIYNPLWGGTTHTLDVTHPRAKEWISEFIDGYVRDWGYTYLKLDFLYSACYRGMYHDPGTTGAVRLREALELIRRAAGKKTFLLGCGCPIFPAIGIMDGMRIGMDVNHFWKRHFWSVVLRDRNFPTLRSALINTITRSAMHRRFWLNDPDCLMVRTSDTNLTEKQIMIMVAVMCLSGGMLLISDEMKKLQGDRFDVIRAGLELNRECAPHTPLPLGLMEAGFPRGLYNPAGYLGVWNPTEKPERVSFPIPARLDHAALRRARELRTDQKMPWHIRENRIFIALAPFESMIARIH